MVNWYFALGIRGEITAEGWVHLTTLGVELPSIWYISSQPPEGAVPVYSQVTAI